MKSKLTIAFLLLSLRCYGFISPGQGDGWLLDESSYDTISTIGGYGNMSGTWIPTAIVLMNPLVTNIFVSISHSGNSWQQQRENVQEQDGLPAAAWVWNLGGTVRNLMLPNDNSAYNSNTCFQWGTNLADMPITFWNGTTKTDEGYSSFASLTKHYFLSGIDNLDSNGKLRADANTNLSTQYSTPTVRQWYDEHADNFWNGLPSNAGGHPGAGQQLEMTLLTLVYIGWDTNVWSASIDASTLIPTTNQCCVVSLAGGVTGITGTIKLNRQSGVWDVPDGVVTNDATGLFSNTPSFGNMFNCVLKVQNLTAGNYNVTIDSELAFQNVTASQLANGLNFFTNYHNPWWHQGVSVKNAELNFRGADLVTGIGHSAGQNGVLGTPDLVNYQSGTFGVWQAGTRGSDLVAASTANVASLWNYTHQAYVAAQQTNHTFVVTSVIPVPVPAPFR